MSIVGLKQIINKLTALLPLQLALLQQLWCCFVQASLLNPLQHRHQKSHVWPH